jgi:hypothetical protein
MEIYTENKDLTEIDVKTDDLSVVDIEEKEEEKGQS